MPKERRKNSNFIGLLHGQTIAGKQSTPPDIDNTRLNPTRFSDLHRLVRVTAWVWRFIMNCTTEKEKREKRRISVEEYDDSLLSLIRNAQHQVWSKEIKLLKKGRVVDSGSKLFKLQPWMDMDNVVRCGSRLQYSEHICWEARNPILLPRGDWMTMLLVKEAHERGLHVGVNGTMSLLSGRYWLVGGRDVIVDWLRRCTYCHRRRTKPIPPRMGPLPRIRSQPTLRAFEHVSLDYAGPFVTKQGRGRTRQKRWLCLFGCMATRAIHLEVAFSLDVDSFLNCLTRFVARRGVPKIVWSDNGTNFVAADRENFGSLWQHWTLNSWLDRW